MDRSKSTEKKNTIYDVAEHAGVAISTVSRVLNDDDDVADSTREEVLKAIEKLEYTRDRAARSLAIQSSKTIAAALPTFTTPFHNELLKGVRDQLDDEDIDLMICDLEWESIRSSLESFLSRGTIEGLIFASHTTDARVISRLSRLSIPVVIIGARVGGINSFYWNSQLGAEMAVDHLISMGHENISMIASSTNNIPSEEIMKGYKSALSSHDIYCGKDTVFRGDTKKHDGFSEEAGYEAMQKIIDNNPESTAIFASSDVHALGAWQAINEESLKVPSDFALIGYDNIKISRYVGLSSISQDIHKVGMRSTERLLSEMKGTESENINVSVKPKLKKRKSTLGNTQ